MRKIRNEFQTCFDLFLFSLVSISSFFSLIDWFDFYLFCQMKPTINWFSHFISSDHWFDLFDLFELIDGNRIKMIINWFVCLFVSSLVGWWWWIKSHHLTHTFTHSLTLTWLCWLIWLVIDDWLLRLVWNDWFHWFLISSFIDWLIWLNHLTLIEPSQMKLMFILIAFSFHLMFHSFEFIWID